MGESTRALLVLLAVIAAFLIVPSIAWIKWLRHPRPRPWSLFVVAIATTAPLATGWIGVVVAQIQIRSFQASESVEPSAKARLLAETISDAMNRTVFAVIGAGIVCAIVAIVSRLRERNRSPR